MLRNRLPDETAAYPDPILGLDLRVSEQDLTAGQVTLTQNCVWDGGVRKRYGCQTLTSVSQGMFRGTGLYRFYYSISSKSRLAAWNTGIFTVSDTGTINTLTSGLAANQDVFFTTWSVTDAAYVSNGSDILGRVDNTVSFATLTGTNIPSSPKMVKPFVDRLFAIQGSVVVSTDPRVDNTWSPTTSSWAAYRPTGSSGNPTAIYVHSRTGLQGDPVAQLLIFQSGSVSALEGTDFGSNVTAASPPTGWDATLRVIDPRIGTESPYSICTVPALGTFWYTQDNNVAFLPFAQGPVQLIGDKLIALNRSDLYGIDSTNPASRAQVTMVYHNRYLKLSIPVNATYPTIQYWLDLRTLQNHPERGFVWYGPMQGTTMSRMIVEDQNGDNQLLVGIEGNPLNGIFLYQVDTPNLYYDAIGNSITAVQSVYRTFFHDFGMPSMEKMMPMVRVDFSGNGNQLTIAVDDLHSYGLVSGLSLTNTDGSAFSYWTWGDGKDWGGGQHWGSTANDQIGHCFITNQTDTMPLGDKMAITISHLQASAMQINALYPQIQVRKRQPVS